MTDTQIKTAKLQTKDYPIYDGNGLLLVIKSTGSKIWQFRYYRLITNKRTTISFGSYPEISLQRARKLRDDARELIRQGVDPQEYKAEQEQQKQDELNNTFEKIAIDWFRVKSKSNLKPDTLKDIWRSLELHILPTLGNEPIINLKAKHFISALQPVKDKGSLETVKRLIQRINEIMYYAINIGIIDANPAAKIGAAFESPIVQNMPALRPEQLPKLMSTLQTVNIGKQTRCLLEWQLLTMTRPSEASGARWEEIDLDNKLWTIPIERMKMSKEHVIPLSPQALVILEIMKPISGHREHLFPSMKAPFNKPMSSQTVNAAIKRIGFSGRLVAHGLRSIASTALNEQGFAPDVIEAALAHVDKNSVRRAYNRSTYLEQRRIIMNWWGDFVEQASKGNVSLSGTKSFKVVNG